jgi:hypothetical protein
MAGTRGDPGSGAGGSALRVLWHDVVSSPAALVLLFVVVLVPRTGSVMEHQILAHDSQ